MKDQTKWHWTPDLRIVSNLAQLNGISQTCEGDRLVKSSKYIPKGKLERVQELDNDKAPVREILKLLGKGRCRTW